MYHTPFSLLFFFSLSLSLSLSLSVSLSFSLSFFISLTLSISFLKLPFNLLFCFPSNTQPQTFSLITKRHQLSPHPSPLSLLFSLSLPSPLSPPVPFPLLYLPSSLISTYILLVKGHMYGIMSPSPCPRPLVLVPSSSSPCPCSLPGAPRLGGRSEGLQSQ